MRRGMDDGEDEHGIGDLTVEPGGLVERQPSQAWSQPFDDIAAHGQQDQRPVQGEHQAGPPGDPDRVRQDIQLGQLGV